MGYDPELDISSESEVDASSYLQTIIGILWWIFSSLVALLRDGHLDVALHIMAYVGQKYDSRLIYIPSHLEIDHYVFKECDSSEFYWDTHKATPMNATEP